MAAFDHRESNQVRGVDTITSRLAFPKASIGYCAVRYVGAEAIMAAVLEIKRRCAQPWRDARDATPPQAGFTDFFTHVN
jgi:hypothetical protein